MCRIFVVSNACNKEEKWLFLKDALSGGGGVPTGAGLVDGGVDHSRGGRVGLAGVGTHAPELAWTGGQGGGARARGRCKGFGSGGVGGRDTGPRDSKFRNVCRIFVVSNAYKKEEKWRFLKDALWGGGGTHRSWPGGRRGRPRALISGLLVGSQLRLVDGRSGRRGKGSGGGCKGFGSGGVGGRDTGPQKRSKFRNVCCIRKKKNCVF